MDTEIVEVPEPALELNVAKLQEQVRCLQNVLRIKTEVIERLRTELDKSTDERIKYCGMLREIKDKIREEAPELYESVLVG